MLSQMDGAVTLTAETMPYPISKTAGPGGLPCDLVCHLSFTLDIVNMNLHAKFA